MKRDRTQACHCPPEEMCPKTAQEWREAKTLPPYIAGVCCARPVSFECNAEYETRLSTSCPATQSLPTMTAQFCTNYAAKPVSGAQDPSDADYDPDAAANVAQQKRKDAATAYNDCFSARCATDLDKLMTQQIKTYKNNARTVGDGDWPREDLYTNKDQLEGFARCELRCRVKAAEILGIELTANEKKLSEALSNPNKVRQMGPRGRFNDAVTTLLQETYHERNTYKRMPDFPDSALNAALQCGDVALPAICMSLTANDGSCASCLSPDTQITLADGNAKSIEQISKGDRVKTSNNGEATVAEVVIKDWPSLTLYSINGGTLKLTADHPVMTTTGWRAVDYYADAEGSVKKYTLQNVPQLKVGDTLVTLDGEIIVESIEPMETRTNAKTYNLKLEGGDSFYAGGVLVKDN